jgi:hypothetical protein
LASPTVIFPSSIRLSTSRAVERNIMPTLMSSFADVSKNSMPWLLAYLPHINAGMHASRQACRSDDEHNHARKCQHLFWFWPRCCAVVSCRCTCRAALDESGESSHVIGDVRLASLGGDALGALPARLCQVRLVATQRHLNVVIRAVLADGLFVDCL